MKKQVYLLLLSGIIFFTTAIVLQVYENSELSSYRHGDCLTYEKAADYIYEQGFTPHPLRPMLYPLFVGIPKLVTSNYRILLYFNYSMNFVFWLLTVLFIYKSVRLILTSKYAFFLALLFAFNISNILLNPQVLTESIYTCVLALVMYLLTTYFIRGHQNYLTAAIGIFLLSILIRPTGLYLALMSVSVYLVYLFKQKQYKFVLLMLLICLCPLFQMTKMYQHRLNFTISNIGNYTLYYFLCSYAEGIKATDYDYFNYERIARVYGKVREERIVLIDAKNDYTYWQNMKIVADQDVRHQLTTNFSGIAFSYVRNVVSNSVAFSFFALHLENVNHTGYFPLISRLAVPITKIQNGIYSLSLLITPFLLLYNRKKIKYKKYLYLQITIVAIAIYTILISGISFAQGDRFNIVLVPIALLNFALIGQFYATQQTSGGLLVALKASKFAEILRGLIFQRRRLERSSNSARSWFLWIK